MLIYPQLATGASTQYPTLKRRASRTIVNHASDGRTIRLADPGAGAIEWEISYSGLVDEEAASLEEFFRATEGRLRTFTFLDPLDNLLAWSEELAGVAWVAGPSLSLDRGLADPLGAERAWRILNPMGAAQRLEQTIEAPGDRLYCFSLYTRSDSPTSIVLLRNEERRSFAIGSEWSRVMLPGSGAGGETVTFGIELEAGSQCEVFGLQAEAQPGASGYRRTGSRGGVYGNARFQDDLLRITTEDMNQHSCLVRIEHANHI
jgi:hypothetical protein